MDSSQIEVKIEVLVSNPGIAERNFSGGKQGSELRPQIQIYSHSIFKCHFRNDKGSRSFIKKKDNFINDPYTAWI